MAFISTQSQSNVVSEISIAYYLSSPTCNLISPFKTATTIVITVTNTTTKCQLLNSHNPTIVSN